MEPCPVQRSVQHYPTHTVVILIGRKRQPRIGPVWSYGSA
jgi:hypothetical protein